MEEVWKKIKYSDEYEVSNLGRVRHLYENQYDINTGIIKKIPKIKYINGIIRSGYKRIRIYKNRYEFKNYNVHKLVAEAFIPNPNNYPIINHKDEDKTNNRVDNLEWCTQSYNCSYGLKADKTKKSRQLKIAQYDKNNELIKIWDNMSIAGKELNINYRNISSCCNNEQKTAGGYIWKFYK